MNTIEASGEIRYKVLVRYEDYFLRNRFVLKLNKLEVCLRLFPVDSSH